MRAIRATRRSGQHHHSGGATAAALTTPPPHFRRHVGSALLLALLSLAAAPAPARAAAAAAASASSASFAATARTVDVGGALLVTGYRLEGDAADTTLVLERRDIWAPGACAMLVGGWTVERWPCMLHAAQAGGARPSAPCNPSPAPPLAACPLPLRPPGAQIWVQAAADAPPLLVPPPATFYYAGTIKGDPASAVLLAVTADGGVNGVAHRSNDTFVIGKAGVPKGASAAAAAAAAAAPMASLRVNTASAPVHKCGNHKQSNRKFSARKVPDLPAGSGAAPTNRRRLQQPNFSVGDNPTRTVTMAIDTDAGGAGLAAARCEGGAWSCVAAADGAALLPPPCSRRHHCCRCRGCLQMPTMRTPLSLLVSQSTWRSSMAIKTAPRSTQRC